MYISRKQKIEIAKKRVEKVKDAKLRKRLNEIVDGLHILISSMEVEELDECIQKCEETGNLQMLKEKAWGILKSVDLEEEREDIDSDLCME